MLITRPLLSAMLMSALACTQRRAPLDARTADSHTTATAASTTTTTAPAAPAVMNDARGILHCDLDLRAYELGERDDGEPSAPARTTDGFFVAFTHSQPLDAGRARTDLMAQRTDGSGALLPAMQIARDVHITTPRVVGDRDTIYVQAQPPSAGRFPLTMFQTEGAVALVDRPAPFLSGWAEDMALGPRGVIATWRTRTGREVERGIDREHLPNISLTASTSTPVPSEQLVASGGSVDMVLVQAPGSLRVAVLDSSTTPRERVLATGPADRWFESSLAASSSRFAVVFIDADMRTLRLQRFDSHGDAIGEATILAPVDDSHVRRHPRITSLADGWAVSYWDGIGPTIQRFDADGRAVGAPFEVRSGDERGGHTEARMVASDDALAVTWHVHEPEFSHGVPQEVPPRPGPRLGVLRCRASR